MTEVMRDSVQPANIPAGTPIVGGYVDGLYGLGTAYWNAAAWARWAATGARLRKIAAVTTNTPSNTCDVERFDLTPAQVPIWWRFQHARGEPDLWAYCDRNDQHAVEDDCWANGIPLDELSMWIATLDGTQVVARYRYPIIAVQFIDRGPYDESVVYDTFGPAPGHLGEDMLYAGPFHAKAATLRVFAAGTAYHDPSNGARATGPLAVGATIGVDGYRYTDSPIQSPDLGPPTNAPGPDFVWWHATSGQWVPDAFLDTTQLAGAPGAALPAGEPLTTYFQVAGQGGGPDDDSAFATKAYVDAGDASVREAIPTKASTTLST